MNGSPAASSRRYNAPGSTSRGSSKNSRTIQGAATPTATAKTTMLVAAMRMFCTAASHALSSSRLPRYWPISALAPSPRPPSTLNPTMRTLLAIPNRATTDVP